MKSIKQTFLAGLRLLSKHGRRVLLWYGIVLIALATLDAAALYFVSQLFSTNATSAKSIQIEAGASTLVIVISLFIAKTVLSTLASWFAVNSFAREEVRIGSANFSAQMGQDWSSQINNPVTDLYNTVDQGPTNLIQGFIFNVVVIASEAANALLMLFALLFLQPLTACIAAIYFLAIAIAQHKLLSQSSANAGGRVVLFTNSVYQLLNDAFNLRKLLSIQPSTSIAVELEQRRRHLAIARARVAFLGLLPRYFMELILAVGLAVIAGVTYAVYDTQSAISAITVFAAAGFRLLPIINKIQGLILQLFSTLPRAQLAIIAPAEPLNIVHSVSDSKEHLALSCITFSYPSSSQPVLTDISISFERGLQYAIIGPSGAGKTTLIDVCLGLLTPQQGVVERNEQLTLAYVPQETYIAGISIEQNVALEWDSDSIDKGQVEEVIHHSNIESLLSREHSESNISGASLSGGQKQRIGLARALYKKPDILFLDEVTSSLDAQTEHQVMKSIHALRGATTVIIVAHRLSTVQHVDRVVYMEDGKVLGIGTFDELRRHIPSLQRQIELGTLHLLD
jgi:ABC-type multidrug transport system fused ATPase/permease subunit